MKTNGLKDGIKAAGELAIIVMDQDSNLEVSVSNFHIIWRACWVTQI